MSHEPNRAHPKSRGNPWSLILLSSLVPLLFLFALLFKWYQERTDFRRVTSQFVQRQNTVMAYDAVEIATGFGDLLEKAGRDVRMLSLIPSTADNFRRFYQSQMGDYTRYNTDHRGTQEPLPFYNKLEFYSASGAPMLRLLDGKTPPESRHLKDCKNLELCDQSLAKKALTLPPGELSYGKLMRYFSPEGTPEDDLGAGLSVAYRSVQGIYIIQIDYRHLRDHLTSPSFPYETKRNLVEAYQQGNYIFIVDIEHNIITHPHYWKAAGINRKTGEWQSPMTDDAQAGTNPINISAYQRGVLWEYFQRLLNVSFKQNGVDIFQAPNLAGTSRILSVAPIIAEQGQYKDSKVFGHVIIACNIEYFEAPKEVIVPYY